LSLTKDVFFTKEEMNTISFIKYFSILNSQKKYEEVIETFYKMDSLEIKKCESIFANTMTAYAHRGDL
jgi:hypothetical protein